MSKDKNMLQAYLDKKDLYAVIASLSFNKPYEECLEFYKEFSVIGTDDKKVIAGSGKDYEYTVENNCVKVPSCYLVRTDSGEKEVSLLSIGEKLITDEGLVKIIDIVASDGLPSDKVLLKLVKV